MRHHLVLVDRGYGYAHRYTATCVCGWIAVHRRHRRDAKRLYRGHVESCVGETRPRRNPVPGRPTPADQLPEMLR